MINALLAIEDRKFFEHEGVNWRSIARAFLSVATSGRLKQGGSTITMQLVKNYLLTREKKSLVSFEKLFWRTMLKKISQKREF